MLINSLISETDLKIVTSDFPVGWKLKEVKNSQPLLRSTSWTPQETAIVEDAVSTFPEKSASAIATIIKEALRGRTEVAIAARVRLVKDNTHASSPSSIREVGKRLVQQWQKRSDHRRTTWLPSELEIVASVLNSSGNKSGLELVEDIVSRGVLRTVRAIEKKVSELRCGRIKEPLPGSNIYMPWADAEISILQQEWKKISLIHGNRKKEIQQIEGVLKQAGFVRTYEAIRNKAGALGLTSKKAMGKES